MKKIFAPMEVLLKIGNGEYRDEKDIICIFANKGYELAEESIKAEASGELPEIKVEGGANTLDECVGLLEIARDNKCNINLDWVEVGILLRALASRPAPAAEKGLREALEAAWGWMVSWSLPAEKMKQEERVEYERIRLLKDRALAHEAPKEGE